MKNTKIKHNKTGKTDRGWASSSFTKKEKILLVIYIFASLSFLFFVAWSLRSMPNNMFKLVEMSAVLLVCMLVGPILFIPFGGVKQNENKN